MNAALMQYVKRGAERGNVTATKAFLEMERIARLQLFQLIAWTSTILILVEVVVSTASNQLTGLDQRSMYTAT